MTPTLLLDDTPAIAPLALAIERGGLALPAALEVVPTLTAEVARARPDTLAFVPVGDYPLLQGDRTVLPELAAGGVYNAAIVLVADRPLPTIERCLVDLADASRTAEALARATLQKFYGLTPVGWTCDAPPEDPELPVVAVREGGEALHLLDEPGSRAVVDLGRAWFLLTGLPPVTHLLLAPDRLLAAAPDAVAALRAALAAAPDALAPHRDALRDELATRYGVARALLDRYYDDQFATLTGDAQKSLRALLTAAARSMALPPVGALKLPPGVVGV